MKQSTSVVQKKGLSVHKPERRKAETIGPNILLVGSAARNDALRLPLQKFRVTIDEANNVESIAGRLVENTIAVIVTGPIPGRSMRKAVALLHLQEWGKRPAIFALVNDGISGAEARALYAEGATAVFEWPRDGLLFHRLAVELLTVDFVRFDMTLPDAALARTISAHLKMVRGYGRLRVQVDNGVALVAGSVPHLWQKERIRELVSNIPGVRSVVMRALLVEPSDRTDVQIRRSILRLLSEASNIDETTLAVNVQQGYVTMAGSVTDRRELNRVIRLLTSVKGVRHIDRLAVMSKQQKHTDHVVAERLGRTLSHLFPKQIVTAAFFGGVAILSGTVQLLSTRLYIQSIIEDDEAVQRVIDKIEVQSSSLTAPEK